MEKWKFVNKTKFGLNIILQDVNKKNVENSKMLILYFFNSYYG